MTSPVHFRAVFDATPELSEKFHQRLLPVTESGCWLWTGGWTSGGDGACDLHDGMQSLAHRFAYRLAKGNLRTGFTLDHLCRVRCCANPEHVEEGTLRENLLHGIGWTARTAANTACPHGHPFDSVHTLRRSDGARSCKTCAKTQRRVRWQNGKRN